MIGQAVGHYKILDKLGAGGMGEVYRAEDTTLDREVALKVLPAELAQSQERLERFQREAKTLAAIDHPNIVHIFTVEESEGVHFLTMQLVEGRQLCDLIPKSGMPLERIFDLAIPLADALAAAHDKGVIHRDLKPSNIMVTDDGRVKVLDFGLAKLRPDLDTALTTKMPTEPLTEAGRAVGTVPYMSPEQVEGKAVDHRSDLFSLGIILYEMATGQRPFQGDSPASVMSAILRDTPSSVTNLRASSPRELAKIIRRCLVKEPERRFQTARELAIELDELRSEVASGEVWESAIPPPRRRRAMQWAGFAAVGIALVAIAVLIWTLASDQETAATVATPVTGSFTKLVFDSATKGKVSASPDGRFFLYASDASGNWDIYFQRIGGGRAINLTEDSTEDDKQPAFSPDGENIAFRSEREGGGIYIMGATGESVRRVTDHGFLPDWSPDGTKLVFSTSGKLGPWLDNVASRIWTVDLSTGDSQMVLDRSAITPDWSPNGWRIAYQGWWEPSETEMQIDLFTVPADGGEPVAATGDVHYVESPAWSPDGRSLYYVSRQGGTLDLWTMPIDEKSGRVLGTPIRLTSGSNVGLFVSPAGDGSGLIYSSETWSSEIFRVPFDPMAGEVAGPPVSIAPVGLVASSPSVSLDGEWIAFDAEFGQSSYTAIGVIPSDGSDPRQVTDGKYRDRYPRWSPNGRRLAFWGNRSGSSQAWIINADGSGMRQLTDMPGLSVAPPIWSPDGSQLATCKLDGRTSYVFQADKSWSEEAPSELPPFGGPEDLFCPQSWSPDGKLLAGAHYSEIGVERLALYSFESGSYRTPTEQLSAESLWVVWLNDGRRLLINAAGQDSGAIFLLDTESGEYHEVVLDEGLTAAAGLAMGGLSVSQDNRSFYITWVKYQNEIWMLTLGEQE